MATMIPADTEEFTTEGEKTFYRFLHAVAKPDHKYLCWYLPDINGREPDFLLYSEDVGLIIFEVKDWRLDQIISADSQFFTLSIAGKAEKRQNPLHQARDYFHWVMDRIK
ncbi:MAG TPA: nuclease-related domain-containing protein, partial [Smithella sp.]|nr:nuclease-related domain-containing protein [Smithella sp.]